MGIPMDCSVLFSGSFWDACVREDGWQQFRFQMAEKPSPAWFRYFVDGNLKLADRMGPVSGEKEIEKLVKKAILKMGKGAVGIGLDDLIGSTRSRMKPRC